MHVHTSVPSCVHVCACVSMLEQGSTQRRSLSSFGDAVKFLCSHRCPALEVRGPGGSPASGHHLPCADEIRGVDHLPLFQLLPIPCYMVPMKRAIVGEGEPILLLSWDQAGDGLRVRRLAEACVRTGDTRAPEATPCPAGASPPASQLWVRHLGKSKVSRSSCRASLKRPAEIWERFPRCGLPCPPRPGP